MEDVWPSATLVADYTDTRGGRLAGSVDVQLMQRIALADGSGRTMPAGRLPEAARELDTRPGAEHSYVGKIPIGTPAVLPPSFVVIVYVVFYDSRASELYYLSSDPGSRGYRELRPGDTIEITSLEPLNSTTTFPTGTPGEAPAAAGVASLTKVPGGISVVYADGSTAFLPLVESTKDLSAALTKHINAHSPHPEYDSIEDLVLIFENTLI